MPNWVYTKMTVSGDADSIKKFKEDASKENHISEREYDKGTEYWEIFNSIIPMPQEYPHTIWAQSTYWGVKWGDCYTELEDEHDTELVFNVYFAWSIPDAGMIKISKLYPDLTFSLDMDEEGGFFWGEKVWKNGVVIEDKVLDEPSPRFKEWEEEEE